MDKLVAFPAITDWRQWLAEYRPSIRVHIEWDSLIETFEAKEPECQTLYWSGISAQLWYPHYRDEGGKKTFLSDKQPIEAQRAVTAHEKTRFIMRVPCISATAGDLLIVDGCHRLRSLKPTMVILDVLSLSKDQAKYVLDFRNAWWQARINGG